MNIDWSYLVDQEQWHAKLAFVCKLRTTKHNNKAKAKQIARTLSSIPHALVSLVPLDWFAIITQEDFAYTLCAYLVRLFPSQHGMNFSSLSLWAVILLCPQEAINAKGDMLHDLLKCHHRSHWEKAHQARLMSQYLSGHARCRCREPSRRQCCFRLKSLHVAGFPSCLLSWMHLTPNNRKKTNEMHE